MMLVVHIAVVVAFVLVLCRTVLVFSLIGAVSVVVPPT